MRWAMRVEVRFLYLPLPADSPRDEERMTDSMDIYCKRCGEPWEIDSLHEVADSEGTTFSTVLRRFQAVGCTALSGEYFGAISRCETVTGTDTATIGMVYDILGDDIDGAAAMFSDLRMS